MKIYSKLALILGFAMAFVACSDDEKFQAGTWDGTADDDTVYFAADSISFNEIFTPSDPNTKTFTVHRKDSVGAKTIEFNIIENTNNMFQVSPATFADGEHDATFTVDFSKAELDKTYTLTIKPKSSSSWDATNNLFSYTVLIEKWNDLGIGLYTDDLVDGVFNTVPVDLEVTILEKDSKPGLYRLVYPYGENYPYNDPGDWDDSKDYNIEIDATDPTAVVIPAQPLGIDWGYGMFWVRSYETGTLEEGIITFPANGLDVAMANYKDGGWVFYGNPNGAFRVILPGKYATMKEEQPSEVKAAHIKANRMLK